MSFDCSRLRFDPTRDFAGVVHQQGRVSLDADWNEWLALLARRLQAGTLDALGRAVVPRESADAFRIRWVGTGLSIGPGRAYIDGLLVENHGTDTAGWSSTLAEPAADGVVAYTAQPYYPSPPALPAGDGPHLVYLDVWRRDLTHLQDPGLIEKALGVDTTGRWQMVWQVKVLPNWTGGGCTAADLDLGAFDPNLAPSGARLSVTTGDLPGSSSPCEIPPAAGYKGLENQLYRVEVHQGGPLGTATFKWSRDNATVASRVLALPALDRLVVETLGRDERLGFANGDWVEIIDRRRELANLPGELRHLRTEGGVDAQTRTLTLTLPLDAGDFALGGGDDYLLVRRWDQAGNQYREDGSVLIDVTAAGGAIPIQPAGTRMFLEQGILVEFTLPAGGRFRTGDYWTFSARSVDASVETLERTPPQGIHHHYAPLALIRRPAEAVDQRVPLTPSAGTLQVCSVQASDGTRGAAALRPGQSLSVDRLGDGIALLIRQRLDPASVTDGALYVTAEIPYRLPGAYSGAPQGAVVAYQPVVLPAQVALASQGVLTWSPYGQTLAFLRDLLARDVARLGNVRFEGEFEVFDHGGPRSAWALAPGNLVIQTNFAAGTGTAGRSSLPTSAVHRYRLEDGAIYAGASAELDRDGMVGMIYNWRDERNWSFFYLHQYYVMIGFGGFAANVTLGHRRMRNGELDPAAAREHTLTAGQSYATSVSLDIRQGQGQRPDGAAEPRLQFGGRAVMSYGAAIAVQNLEWGQLPTRLEPSTRMGLVTASTGSGRFIRLQVNYPDQAPVALVPAGIAQRLLARLVLKRSLLAVTGPGGSAPGGVFAAPVPQPDFETWFWVTPAAPAYGYGYGGAYGIGGLFAGIGVQRLLG